MDLVGRIIFALPLAFSGLNHFMNFKAMVGYAESKNVPMPQLSVIGSAIVLIVGLLGVVLNFQAVIAGWLIVAFMVGSAVLFHNFWSVEDASMRMVEMSQFIKNIALAGAAIAIAYLL